MSKLTRYDIFDYNGGCEPEECFEGEWCKWEDVEAEMIRLKEIVISATINCPKNTTCAHCEKYNNDCFECWLKESK